MKPGKEGERKPRLSFPIALVILGLPVCGVGMSLPLRQEGSKGQAALDRKRLEGQEGHGVGADNAEGREKGEPDPERLEQRASSAWC